MTLSTARVPRARSTAALGVLALAAAGAAFGATRAPAASVTRVRCSVGGPHGLIAAIRAADRTGGGILDLAGHCTYTLKKPDGNLGGEDGLPALTGRITINGNTGTRIVRSSARGTPNFRILEVAKGASVSISHLTISGGRLTEDSSQGGGIDNAGTIISLSHVSIRNSSAAFGGGLVNVGRLLALDHDAFTGNSAGNGGGLANDATGTIRTIANTTFSGNRAGIGGAITNLGSISSLRHSTVSGNRLTRNGAGGGIANQAGLLNMTADVVSDNRATGGPQASGGGIDNNSGRVTLTDSLVTGNVARGVGGGLRNEEQTLPRFVFVIRSTVVVNNTVTSARGPAAGGGIYNIGGMSISGGTIRQNRAAAQSGRAVGAGVYNAGSLGVTGTIITANLASDKRGAAEGAGLYVDAGSTKTSLVRGGISSNRAVGARARGGGIFFAGGKPVTLVGTAVSKNSPQDCAPPGRVKGCGTRGSGAPDPA